MGSMSVTVLTAKPVGSMSIAVKIAATCVGSTSVAK